jgi:CRP-like cAMP-binding protein
VRFCHARIRVEAGSTGPQNDRDVFGRSRYAKTIRALPLFAGCTNAEAASIAGIGHEESIEAGTELTREGRAGDDFYVLLDGHAEVVRDGSVLSELGPGDFFGEIALLGHSTRTATVRAASPLRVLVIPGRAFRALLGRQPDVQLKVLDTLAERL